MGDGEQDGGHRPVLLVITYPRHQKEVCNEQDGMLTYPPYRIPACTLGGGTLNRQHY